MPVGEAGAEVELYVGEAVVWPWITDWIGVIRFRNLLFLKEISPEPSILTLYCWWGSTSTMRPERSHLLGLLPAWF